MDNKRINDLDVKIPTINDGRNDFLKLIKFDNEVRKIEHNYIPEETTLYFDFSECLFLRPNGISYLAAISTLLKEKNFGIYYKMKTIKPKVLQVFIDDGFLQEHFKQHDKSSESLSSDAIMFKNFVGDLNVDYELSEKITDYVQNDWLKNEWIHAEDDVKKDITKNMYELFANALEHSQSNIGCFACGQKYDETSEIVLTITDLGVGIVKSVQDYLGGGTITPKDAILWAMKNGNTTRSSKIGGLGLNIFKDFIRLNKGELAIYCNNISYKFDSDIEEVRYGEAYFSGTMINIRIKLDGMLYKYKRR